jgi:hypothetical protein
MGEAKRRCPYKAQRIAQGIEKRQEADRLAAEQQKLLEEERKAAFERFPEEIKRQIRNRRTFAATAAAIAGVGLAAEPEKE